MENYTKNEEGALVVETPQPAIVQEYNREDIVVALDNAKEMVELKKSELDYANAQVARYEALLAKYTELSVT